MYDHTKQYRCSIIRGKSQSEMDNILPLYAKIVDSICPCESNKFNLAFDNAIKPALKENATQKTLNNHRTEIAGKLFGMYYTADDGWVYPSERTMKFIEDSDTPAFFKDICYKMQFPNGQIKKDLKMHISNNINIRQYPFILRVMLLAKSDNIALKRKEIGYYILNSLDVLQGNANPLEVYDAIVNDRKNGVERDIKTLGKELSWDWQHINEQINLLELANLIIVNDGEVSINPREMTAVQIFADKYADKPMFDVYSYDLETLEIRKKFYFDWDNYFAQLSDMAGSFDNTAESLGSSDVFDNI